MCKTFMIGAMKPVSLLFDQPTYVAQGPWSILFCSHYDPGMTLTFLWQGQFCNLSFYTGKGNNDGFFAACGLELVDIVNLMSK